MEPVSNENLGLQDSFNTQDDLKDPIDPKTVDIFVKNVSNIVTCAGWLRISDYTNPLESYAQRIAGSGTTSLIDLTLAKKPYFWKTIGYIRRGGFFNAKIANKDSNKDVEDLLKCTKYLIASALHVLDLKKYQVLKLPYVGNCSNYLRFLPDFIGLALQAHAVFHASKEVYYSGMHRKAMLKFTKEITLFAFMAKISTFNTANHVALNILIDFSRLPYSLLGVQELYNRCQEYQKKKRIQEEIKKDRVDYEIKDSPKKYGNTSVSLYFCGG